MNRGAIFSPDRRHRYVLWRTWSDDNRTRFVVIGLNPSTANEMTDDPTIRRCVDFARRHEAGGLVMVNLFSLVTTDPHALANGADDPVGPEADRHLESATRSSERDLVVCAWGAFSVAVAARGRKRAVLSSIRRLWCFGYTKDGHPKHPLYLKASTQLVPYLFDLG